MKIVCVQITRYYKIWVYPENTIFSKKIFNSKKNNKIKRKSDESPLSNIQKKITDHILKPQILKFPKKKFKYKRRFSSIKETTVLDLKVFFLKKSSIILKPSTCSIYLAEVLAS